MNNTNSPTLAEMLMSNNTDQVMHVTKILEDISHRYNSKRKRRHDHDEVEVETTTKRRRRRHVAKPKVKKPIAINDDSPTESSSPELEDFPSMMVLLPLSGHELVFPSDNDVREYTLEELLELVSQ
jgi:hypothetical protein